MTELSIVDVDAATLSSWRDIHNEIIPTSPLSLEEVRDRALRYRLTLAFADDVLIGNGTLRPPDADACATVIVRVLPAFRRRGLGSLYLRKLVSDAQRLGAERAKTIVLASNLEGLVFAGRRGFMETQRYLLGNDEQEFVELVVVIAPTAPP